MPWDAQGMPTTQSGNAHTATDCAATQARMTPSGAAKAACVVGTTHRATRCTTSVTMWPLVPCRGQGMSRRGRRNPAHRNLLRGKACTYDTRCCGKECVHRCHDVDDRAMSACCDRSTGPGLPLPGLCASIVLALVFDGLQLGPSNKPGSLRTT